VSAIRRFAKIAKRSGATEVYTVARDELEDVRDLGCLLLHLRRVDPSWSLDIRERRRLAHALLEADSDREIRDQLDISQKTLARRRQELVHKRNRAPEPAFQSGVSGTKTPPATRRSLGPILHAEASSGVGDFEAIARLLEVAA
jgi:hypothetical protein